MNLGLHKACSLFGWLGTVWCPYCPYQYLESELMEQQSKIKDWMDESPVALQTVECVKHPPGAFF